MIRTPVKLRCRHPRTLGRHFSSSSSFGRIRDLKDLPKRLTPTFQDTKNNLLLALQWPSPPRNVLLTKKRNSPAITQSLVQFAQHIKITYPDIALVFEPETAKEIHEGVAFDIYTRPERYEEGLPLLHERIDLISTLGGDGTILHAASLFATANHVPPILSFSMGTLGFLGEWKFHEYKRAFREAYMSGADISVGHSPGLTENDLHKHILDSSDSQDHAHSSNATDSVMPSATEIPSPPNGWASLRGKSLGRQRNARVLLRNRLRIGVHDSSGARVSATGTASSAGDMHAMNEVIIHRGSTPHLAVIEAYTGGRFLTEAVADGMIVSTPTGSTAYSLSSGGSIVHPLVSSLLLTPVAARSLSFRPLVLPANTPITLRLSEKNRAEEVDVSIDGIRRQGGLRKGMEVRVCGESIKDRAGRWTGGVPSIVRGTVGSDGEVSGEDHWVGGLNGLLKFNYPFGEQSE